MLFLILDIRMIDLSYLLPHRTHVCSRLLLNIITVNVDIFALLNFGERTLAGIFAVSNFCTDIQVNSICSILI